jgi:hypothetical protein
MSIIWAKEGLTYPFSMVDAHVSKELYAILSVFITKTNWLLITSIFYKRASPIAVCSTNQVHCAVGPRKENGSRAKIAGDFCPRIGQRQIETV